MEDWDLTEVLRCPLTEAPMRREPGRYVSTADPDVGLEIQQGVLRGLRVTGPQMEEVLEIQRFYEATPFPNYDNGDDVGALLRKSRARVFPELLDRSIPFHATVLEIGCGTGQLSSFLSLGARRVLGVDLSWRSLELAEAFKRNNSLRGVAFAQMNIFELPVKPEAFDVVICSGVLHHTPDPEKGFRAIVKTVRKDGHIVVGLYNRYGRMRTRFRRLLFKLGLLGEASLGGRSAKDQAWIADQYANPLESTHSLDEVLGWFERAGVEFVRWLPGPLRAEPVEADYRRSLFEPRDKGSRLERLLAQLAMVFKDGDGDLFIVIGRKRHG